MAAVAHAHRCPTHRLGHSSYGANCRARCNRRQQPLACPGPTEVFDAAVEEMCETSPDGTVTCSAVATEATEMTVDAPAPIDRE